MQTPLEVTDEQKLEEAFLFVPYCYKKCDWSGAIQWKILVEGEHAVLKTVIVNPKSESAVLIRDEWPLPATEVLCTVTLSRKDFLEIAEGSVSPVKAFMEKKIQVDKLSNLLKFGQAFSFDKTRFETFINTLRDTNDILKAAENLPHEEKSESLADLLKRGISVGAGKVKSTIRKIKAKKLPRRIQRQLFPNSASNISFLDQLKEEVKALIDELGAPSKQPIVVQKEMITFAHPSSDSTTATKEIGILTHLLSSLSLVQGTKDAEEEKGFVPFKF